ncbi:hypothetical protein SAMN02982929_04382 [Saccharopolyspora kobensis]|uniref:Uncharacterized protein n=1 Tax=Saccharopolyspora kobensis TaxID=146035 RepID=A0A1H6DHA1_9PSEU|nr:hypothetical protein [Saccharopolyspora kobensis]SEG84153.1 hypothetical protein SAMN02982929_04382 [Saccharopolyspora kobensis]SFD29528.1 hypothetical protein SAMN05216506_103409 [Saccharopolyspora kobensis]
MTHEHFPASALRAYAAGQAAEADAIEDHALGCAPCRQLINEAAAGDPLLEQVRAALTPLPPQWPRPGRWRRIRVLLNSAPAVRGAWLFAVLLVLACAIGLDQITPEDSWWSQHGSALLLFAPVLPVLGVALCFGPFGDPAHEITAVTPFGGLRLVLWRTMSVLLTTVPAAALVGAITGRASVTTWLLPCLGLTALTLALGSLFRLEIVAVAVTATWWVLVGGPLFNEQVPVLVDRPLPLLWSALMAASATVLYLRRTRLHSNFGS